jgi:hypothetical protein
VVTERVVICLKEIQMILKDGKGMKPGGPSRYPTTVEVVMSIEESTVGGLAVARWSGGGGALIWRRRRAEQAEAAVARWTGGTLIGLAVGGLRAGERETHGAR